MKPYKVLGVYKPTKWRPWKVGRDITAMTNKLGMKPLHDPIHGPQMWAPWVNEKLHAEVKRRTPKNPKGEDWHQDGDLDPGSKMNHTLVLWASNHPTEFEVNGQVYQPKPYEVVAFNNLDGRHRRPLDAPRVRWMFRQRMEKNN